MILKKYTTKNTEQGKINYFELGPKDMVSAHINGRKHFQSEFNKISDINKLDKVTQKMMIRAYDQLEVINEASRQRYEERKEQFEDEIKSMKKGENKTWDNSYTNYEGQETRDTIGVEKNIDGQTKYYYIEDNPKHGPQKIYISEDKFYERISDTTRNEVKAEQGLGREMYTLTADDGSKFIITDSRDDDEKANSFNDGCKDINMYHVAPDGSVTQMNKEDVKAMITANGITEQDMTKGKTNKLSIDNLKQAVSAHGKDTVRTVGRFMVDSMSNSTSTHER